MLLFFFFLSLAAISWQMRRGADEVLSLASCMDCPLESGTQGRGLGTEESYIQGVH